MKPFPFYLEEGAGSFVTAFCTKVDPHVARQRKNGAGLMCIEATWWWISSSPSFLQNSWQFDTWVKFLLFCQWTAVLEGWASSHRWSRSTHLCAWRLKQATRYQLRLPSSLSSCSIILSKRRCYCCASISECFRGFKKMLLYLLFSADSNWKWRPLYLTYVYRYRYRCKQIGC